MCLNATTLDRIDLCYAIYVYREVFYVRLGERKLANLRIAVFFDVALLRFLSAGLLWDEHQY
jgi:hypothetical protein